MIRELFILLATTSIALPATKPQKVITKSKKTKTPLKTPTVLRYNILDLCYGTRFIFLNRGVANTRILPDGREYFTGSVKSEFGLGAFIRLMRKNFGLIGESEFAFGPGISKHIRKILGIAENRVDCSIHGSHNVGGGIIFEIFGEYLYGFIINGYKFNKCTCVQNHDGHYVSYGLSANMNLQVWEVSLIHFIGDRSIVPESIGGLSKLGIKVSYGRLIRLLPFSRQEGN